MARGSKSVAMMGLVVPLGFGGVDFLASCRIAM